MPRKDKFNIKTLSIIVPAYKQEKTILKDIKNISSALNELKIKYELIIVIDGIIDKTYYKLSRQKIKNVKIIVYERNEGKGHAIRFGMLHAKGDVIGFIDAGMDINPVGFIMLLNHMEWYNAHIIVGSKLHPVSRVDYPFYRTILSWGYRLLTWSLFGFKIKDTQVGLKFFKRDIVKDVFPRLLVKSYAFDIEMLAVAYSLGYKRIYEAPVIINFKNDTSIISKSLWRTIYLMIWDTLAVFYRLKILKYYTRLNKVKHNKTYKKESKVSLSLSK